MDKDKRFHIIDTLRGLAVVNMLAYHFMYDWVYIFGHDSSWFELSVVVPWQQYIAWSFIIVSGISFHLGGKTVQAGIKLVALGTGISLATYAFIPEQRIRFGVLSLIGVSILVVSIFEKPLKRLPTIVGAGLSLFLALIFWQVPEGRLLGFDLFQAFYSTSFLYPWGLPFPAFTSADYFPLLPWFFVFLLGFYLGKGLIMEERLTYRGREGFLSRIGRYSLPIYLIHQPLIYLGLWLVYGARGSL